MTPGHTLTAARRTARAVAALAMIGALLVGVPYLLWRFAGWPLPGELPNGDEVGRALSRTTVSDAAIVKAVALVGWFGCTLLCWSMLVEIWAVVRGVPASRLRFAGPLQGVARQLVASASLLAATSVSSTAAPISSTAPQLVVVEMRDPVLAAALAPTPAAATATVVSPLADAPPAAVAAPAPTEATYTVQRRDSLWKIAECQLGDPLRWRELWELNRGRDFGGITFTNPSLIYSGWVLDLPTPVADPALAAEAPATEDPPAPPAVPVDATAAPVPNPASPEPTEPARSAATTSTAPPAVTAGPIHPPATDPPASRESPPPTDAPADDPVSLPARAPLFAGGVVLASAIVLLLTRLRRSQARRRPPGRVPHRAPAAIAPTETAIRQTGDPTRIHRALTALRAFAAGLGDSDLPPVAAVRVGDSEVEVLLASPASRVPPGFISGADRRVFTTEAEITTATIEGLAGDTPAPSPAVVGAGAVGDDLVLIDLEAAGILTVDGPDATDTVRRISAELATSPASELIEVIVLGAEFDVAGSERIRPVATADEAIKALASAHAATQAALERLGDPSTALARRDHSAEQGWGITVLVGLDPLTESQREQLSQVAAPGGGVAAVLVGGPVGGGAWSLTTGPTTRLEPHGFDLSPATLTAAELAAIDELLADATTGDINERLFVHDEPVETIYLPDAATTAADETPVDVEVRVLGPVTVHGVDPINRRRTVELIAYLALHPGGVSAGRLKTAIWPEAEPSQDTFNVTVHRARSALGLDTGGNHHLPHAVTNGGNYSVGPHVTSDLARFNTLVRQARSNDDETVEAELLRSAVALLRGQVFEDVRGYEWAFTESIVTETEATISDAAHRLAQLELARGDADAANWAGMQGLKAVPGSEPLFRDRMEAAHLNGDPAAVDRIVDELCRYIETLEPLDDLHPDTIELWRRLGRGRNFTGGEA